MHNYKITHTLHRLFTAAFFLVSFSAMAEEVTFSNLASLQQDDRFVVILSTKPTDATPSYIKQIQYDSIEVNSIEAVIFRSEGVHIDVAELQMGRNIDLINKTYQIYEQGSTMLYFDSQHSKQLTDFRNTFLAENFAASESNLRLKAVFNNQAVQQKMFTASENNFGVQAASAKSGACNSRGLLETGQALNILAAGAPYFRSRTAAASSLSGAQANSASAAAVPVIVALDVIAAIFNAGRLIGCAEHDEKITRAEIKKIAEGAVSDRLIDIMMNSIESLGFELQRELHKIAGQNATIASQESWIKDRLKEARKLYATLKSLGYKVSGLTAEIAAIELGLIKKLYKIHEKSSATKQQYIKDEIASKGIRPISLFQEQFNAFEAQEGSEDRGRQTYLNKINKAYAYETGCSWSLVFGDICSYKSYWGECTVGNSAPTGENCKSNGWSTFTIRGENNKAYGLALNYAHKKKSALKERSQMPRVARAIRDYSKYLYETVKGIKKGAYPKLEVLLNNYSGYRLEDHVSIYQHGNKKGYEISLGVGWHNQVALEKLGMFNDDISSLSVPEGLVMTVYRDGNHSGGSKTYASDANLTGNYNDSISSVRIYKEDAITVYENGQQNTYTDAYGTFTRGYAVRLPLGSFTYYDLIERGIRNDDISSITVPSGYKVTLYGNNNFNGSSLNLVESLTLWGKYDNTTSSIKVTINTNPPPPPPPPTVNAELKLTRSGLLTKEDIKVSYTGAPGNAKDWIGLYKRSAANTGQIVWQYINGNTAGSLTFTKDLPAGEYSARIFSNDTYTLLKKIDFTVADKLATTKLRYWKKSNIKVRYQNAPGNAKDWIGLYKRGASNTGSIVWKYIKGRKSGAVIFTKDLPSGNYTARLFRNDSYDLHASFDFSVR